MANAVNTTVARISHITRDPLVREAFRRIELDDGPAPAEVFRPRHSPPNGSVARIASDLDPNILPDVYAMRMQGRCMEPTIMDGDLMKFSSVEPIASGDLVVIHRWRHATPPGDHQAIVKRFIGWARPDGVLVGMDNPGRIFLVPMSAVRTIHKCIGPLAPHEFSVKLTDEQIVAHHAERQEAAYV